MKTSKMIVAGAAIALFACGNSVYAQKGKTVKKTAYEVKFVLQQGMPDTVLYVAYYYADKTYMFDTLYVERKEPYTFIMKGDTARLERGMYILASESKLKYLDFMVDTSYFFTIKIGKSKENTEFINSPENAIVGEFEKGMTVYYSAGQPLVEVLRKNESLSDEEKEKLRTEIKLCQDSMQLFRNAFLQKHENTLFTKVVRMGEDISSSIPDPPRNPDGTLVDSAWSYQYYLNHYWDNCDLSEPALVRTPSFQPKLIQYFDNVVMPIPDTINKYADLLIERVINTPELLRYIIQYITHKYETSQYVGHDAVFVHMVKKYYEKGLCPWVDEEVLKALIERADHLDVILIGRRAPHLYMPDTNGVSRSNYEFDKKYTIMWFWDLNCGHCKTATPILKEFYDRAKDSLDFEVYAVCVGTDSVKWKQAIIEKELNWINVGNNRANIDFTKVYGVQSTPVVFIIDREKKIIAKKIEAKEIENVIRNHEAGKRIR
jgi:thiol-disulfide isomerase/thioredoxin